jgi:hypothetical protein
LIASLADNKIADVNHIGQALAKNSSLRILGFSRNRIIDIKALAKGLLANTSLRILL